MKRGILLFNLGGPETLRDVKPFLFRLFSDPDILIGVPAPVRRMLALFISQVKGPSSIRTYKAIGGGSPQLRWTTIQAQGLEKLLKDDGIEARVAIGMRASTPTIGDGLKGLRDWGAEEIVLFPLFPQFSTTTTGSCFKEARQILALHAKSGWIPKVREISSWPDHPGYIRLLRQTLDEAIAQAESDRSREAKESEPIQVLFSAHSLPMKIIERGDVYPEHVDRTWKAVSAGLKYPHSLAFQSRNGSIPWLKPYTEDALVELAEKQATRRVVVVPLSFVSDHIETLYELDQLYAGLAKKHGITHYYRARSFNDDPTFQKVLASVFNQSA